MTDVTELRSILSLLEKEFQDTGSYRLHVSIARLKNLIRENLCQT